MVENASPRVGSGANPLGAGALEDREIPFELERAHVGFEGVPFLALVPDQVLVDVVAEGPPHDVGALGQVDRFGEALRE
jgi:hypothetical protein